MSKELPKEQVQKFLLSNIEGTNALAILRRLITETRGNSGKKTMQEFSARVMGFIKWAVDTYGNTLKESPLYADFINMAAVEKDCYLMMWLQEKGFPYHQAKVMKSEDDNKDDAVMVTPYQQLLDLPKYVNPAPQKMFDNSADLEEMKRYAARLIEIENQCFPALKPSGIIFDRYISRLFFEISKSMYRIKEPQREVNYLLVEDLVPIRQEDLFFALSDDKTSIIPQAKKDVQAIFFPGYDACAILPDSFRVINFTACIESLVEWVGSNNDFALEEYFFDDDMQFKPTPMDQEKRVLQADRGMKYIFGVAAYEVVRELFAKGYPDERFLLEDGQNETVFHRFLDKQAFKKFTLSQVYLVMHFAVALHCFKGNPTKEYLDEKIWEMSQWLKTEKGLPNNTLQQDYNSYYEMQVQLNTQIVLETKITRKTILDVLNSQSSAPAPAPGTLFAATSSSNNNSAATNSLQVSFLQSPSDAARQPSSSVFFTPSVTSASSSASPSDKSDFENPPATPSSK